MLVKRYKTYNNKYVQTIILPWLTKIKLTIYIYLNFALFYVHVSKITVISNCYKVFVNGNKGSIESVLQYVRSGKSRADCPVMARLLWP